MFAPTFAYRSKGSSSSDSDSEDSDRDHNDWKRATRGAKAEDLEKIPIDPPPSLPTSESSANPEGVAPKRKRNNVWSDVMHDQIISETLDHCGLKNKPAGYGDRGEESYDYTLGYKYRKKHAGEDEEKEEDADSPVERMEQESTVPFKKRHRKFQNRKFVQLNTAEKEITLKIIKGLQEKKDYLIGRVVKYLGIEKAMQLYSMTQTIEDNGGMLINNQKRRRTPGGVYFQLLKEDKDIEKCQVDKIFEGEMTSYDMKKKIEQQKKEKLERRERKKKLEEEEKALLEKITGDVQKPNDAESSNGGAVAMEEESAADNSLIFPSVENTKTSDLEDGELSG